VFRITPISFTTEAFALRFWICFRLLKRDGSKLISLRDPAGIN
jgi:hypothetical protein